MSSDKSGIEGASAGAGGLERNRLMDEGSRGFMGAGGVDEMRLITSGGILLAHFGSRRGECSDNNTRQ